MLRGETGAGHDRDGAGPAETGALSAAADSKAHGPLHGSADPLNRITSGTRDKALEAKIAALEAAISRIDDTWEPDGVAADDYSGTRSLAMDWDESAAAVGRLEPYRLAPTARRDPQAAGTSRGSEGVSRRPAGAELVDESALREIIAEIVRRELRDVLGERITREVRSLVRQEILRAVHSKDAD